MSGAAERTQGPSEKTTDAADTALLGGRASVPWGSGSLTAARLLALQQRAGNRMVGRLLARQVPASPARPAAASSAAQRAAASSQAALAQAEAAARSAAATATGAARRVAERRATGARAAANVAATHAASAARTTGRAAERAARAAATAAQRAASDARVAGAAPAAGARRTAARSAAQVEALIDEVLRAVSWHETACRDVQSGMRTTSGQPASFRSRVQATPVWAIDALLRWVRGAPPGDAAEATRRREALTARGLSAELLAQADRIVGSRELEGRRNRLTMTLAQRQRAGLPDSVSWVWVQVHASSDATTAQQVLDAARGTPAGAVLHPS